MSPVQARASGTVEHKKRSHFMDPAQIIDRVVARFIGTKPERDYYANWLSALELLLLEEGAISAEELKRRQHEYLSMERDDRY